MQRRSRSGEAVASDRGVARALMWKRLWKELWPKKITHFLWRLAHNSLALRMNLKRRGMELDTRCVMCGRLDEDGAHLFLKCKHVIKVWQAMGMDDI